MNMCRAEINNHPLFSQIPETEIAATLACIGGYERNYRKGEYLILDGDSVEAVGLLIRGGIKMIKEDAWGEKSILATITERQVFGESFVFGGVESTVSFVAAEDVTILYLPFRRVIHTCGRSCKYHQRLIDNMVGIIAAKNIQLTEKLEITSKKSMRLKILTYLSQQAQKAQSHRFNVPHSRTEMADYLSVDRSALSRELSRMKGEGIIDFDRNSFLIKRS